MVEILIGVVVVAVIPLLQWLACKGAEAMERARCAAIVANQICVGHQRFPNLVERTLGRCSSCDRLHDALREITRRKDE
jgi:hypothetical protein